MTKELNLGQERRDFCAAMLAHDQSCEGYSDNDIMILFPVAWSMWLAAKRAAMGSGDEVECKACNGEGRIEIPDPFNSDLTLNPHCDACRGYGKVCPAPPAPEKRTPFRGIDDPELIAQVQKKLRDAGFKRTDEPVPFIAPRFPTMLRKMWSGAEVQAWLDENAKPAPVSAEPVYFIRPHGHVAKRDDDSPCWLEASEDAYDYTLPANRRICYTTQPAPITAEPFTYYKEVHAGFPEYSKNNEFSDGQGGGLALYDHAPAHVSAEPVAWVVTVGSKISNEIGFFTSKEAADKYHIKQGGSHPEQMKVQPLYAAPSAAAKDAERYVFWRNAVLNSLNDLSFIDLIQGALPDDDAPPTAAQWDAAIDAAREAK